MAENWRPLSMRVNGGSLDETLYEGVPRHLITPLREWLKRSTTDDVLSRAIVRLRLPVEERDYLYLHISPPDLLEVADYVLHAGVGYSKKSGRELRDELARLLLDGGSAYQINDQGTGLERRVEQTQSEKIREVVGSAGRSPSAAHLTAAWAAIYGLRPNPSLAYSEAIKAVEAAAQPVVEPKNAKATLGTMLGAMRGGHNAGKWTVALGGPQGPTDLSTVVAMCQTLWSGQTTRHGSGRPARPETRDEAEAAVHLAALLVSWFTTGKVTVANRRRSR